MEYVYERFVHIKMTSLGFGRQHQEPFFDWSFYLLEARLNYRSLEDLLDFLAFLVPNLGLKYHKLIREIHANPIMELLQYLDFLP